MRFNYSQIDDFLLSRGDAEEALIPATPCCSIYGQSGWLARNDAVFK